jgi:threonine/homoserine/homoserine lactone efflux protein
MEEIIDKIIANPIYITISVIIIVVLLYAIFKRIMKLLLILAIAGILFLVYVHKTGNSVKDKIERMIK